MQTLIPVIFARHFHAPKFERLREQTLHFHSLTMKELIAFMREQKMVARYSNAAMLLQAYAEEGEFNGSRVYFVIRLDSTRYMEKPIAQRRKIERRLRRALAIGCNDARFTKFPARVRANNITK